MRTRLGDRIHHTPMLSSATAARVAGHASGVGVGRRAPVPQGRAPPEDRLVQAARRAGADLVAHGGRTSRGAITISAGNAGQAYAWAGAQAGVPVTVVMPASAVASKVAACRGYGAEVVLHGAHVGEALGASRGAAGGAGPDAGAPVRRPRGPDRQRVMRARDPRGPARRRRRRGRHRRGRAHRRGGHGDRGEPAARAHLRRGAAGLRGDDQGPRGRRAGPGAAGRASPTGSAPRRPAATRCAPCSATSRTWS